MAVTFPDIEKNIVSYLKSALTSTAFTGTRVAVKRAEPSTTPYPDHQVVVRVAYGPETEYVLRNASLTIDVYATDYQTASNLAFLVESLIRGIVGDPIKKAQVSLGPVRRTDDTKEELRSIDVQLLVKGSN